MMGLFTLSRWLGSLQVFWMAVVISVMFASFPLLAETNGKERSMQYPVFYRTIHIDGLSIFYREAGAKRRSYHTLTARCSVVIEDVSVR